MKKTILSITLGIFILTANAQIEKLAGPRLGITFIGAGPVADFLHEGFDFNERDKYGSTGSAMTTQYGWQWESRFADGGGDVVGIVEWMFLVSGMEQGKFLPSATSIIGVRKGNGYEVGVGPNLSLSGIGMVFAFGYNFKSGNLNLPVNIAFMPGRQLTGETNGEEYKYSSGERISLMIGFNMSK